jgi:hypothetical protein
MRTSASWSACERLPKAFDVPLGSCEMSASSHAHQVLAARARRSGPSPGAVASGHGVSAIGRWPTSSSGGPWPPASTPAQFSGHSLRAGFATEAYAQGVPELVIMRHGRWRAAATMQGYVEEGSLWNDNAAARLGL